MSKYLMARVIEGIDSWFTFVVQNNGNCKFIQKENEKVCITAPCNQEGYNLLYKIGKSLWDSDMCSKFEIAAFDNGELFWKFRPDQWNFERGRYSTCFNNMISEELNAFRSEDFQNDPLELSYLRDYQKRFWNGKTDVYGVEDFQSLISDTQLFTNFNQARDWINLMETKVPLSMLSDMSFIPREYGFSYNGHWILNPFYDETLRFGVDPFSYYGKENIKQFVSKIVKYEKIGLEDSLSSKITEADKKKASMKNEMYIEEKKTDIER